jgi:hypothetical protein
VAWVVQCSRSRRSARADDERPRVLEARGFAACEAPLDRLLAQQATGTVQRLRGLRVFAGGFVTASWSSPRRRPNPLRNARRDLLRILFVFMARTSSALL